MEELLRMTVVALAVFYALLLASALAIFTVKIVSILWAMTWD